MNSNCRLEISEDRQCDVFIGEIMNMFHLDKTEATTTALSMLIRQVVMACQMTGAAI